MLKINVVASNENQLYITSASFLSPQFFSYSTIYFKFALYHFYGFKVIELKQLYINFGGIYCLLWNVAFFDYDKDVKFADAEPQS